MNLRFGCFAVIALAATSVDAAVLGFVQTPMGRVDFHDTAGQCVAGAMQAEFIANDGTVIPGCWRLVGSMFRVAFMDGDGGAIPMAVVQQAKPA